LLLSFCYLSLLQVVQLLTLRVRSNSSKDLEIEAGGNNLCLRFNDGSVWGYAGTPCDASGGGKPCPGWQKLNADSRTVQIKANGSSLYQRLSDGSVWRYCRPALKALIVSCCD